MGSLGLSVPCHPTSVTPHLPLGTRCIGCLAAAIPIILGALLSGRYSTTKWLLSLCVLQSDASERCFSQAQAHVPDGACVTQPVSLLEVHSQLPKLPWSCRPQTLVELSPNLGLKPGRWSIQGSLAALVSVGKLATSCTASNRGIA